MTEKPLKLDSKEQDERQEVFERGREIVLAAPQLYVDVDVEGDGVAGFGSMVALGAQSPAGESFYREIKPISEHFVPRQRKFCEEHGLQRERLMAEAPEFGDVMNDFHDWVKGLHDTHGKQPVLTAFGLILMLVL